ncbi:unnamed protein product [Lepeophtheirus salmonis]|uniref:(salmon louse) hypothetical protein n=1 Tax=Lepeophtheirus salmonis TaxID=72036 RepID=A0A7R8CR94_LEPSM|nr:unnamed protein product [Lepeophtheirus salmonis]CAF2866068.1 unnamed protein product [Lepeophtheirus salmonis]
MHSEQESTTLAFCIKNLFVGKVGKMKEGMDIIVLNQLTLSRSCGLNHRQFISVLADMDTEFGEILYNTKVRCLSRGNVLKHFFAFRKEIAEFIKMKNKEIPLLTDSTFLCDLTFLIDIADQLNAFKLETSR